MEKEPIRHIKLPRLPRSWDELTAEQMVELNRIRAKAGNQEKHFLVKAFCYLAGIRLTKEVQQGEKGTWFYYFQQIDESGKAEEPFPMKAEQVYAIINTYLMFLTHECDRLNDVFPVITLKEKRFHSAGYAMANLTYQQQQRAQAYWSEYFTLEERVTKQIADIKQRIRKGESIDHEEIKKIKALVKKHEEAGCNFLATVFTPESVVTERIVDGRHIQCNGRTKEHIYSVDQTEREAGRFKNFDPFKQQAVMQQFCGVMLHYKKIFPLLFRDGEGAEHTDFIKAESTTINALQAKLGFSNYQTIYDSNAPFILGKLHEIIQEAKSIEEESARLKAHHKK